MSSAVQPPAVPKPTASTSPASAQFAASTIATSVPATHPNFDKFVLLIAALEPLILAGAAPFIKNTQTGAIIASEAPESQALLELLASW